MTKDYDFESGEVLLIDKPKNWTSFDVVKKLRYTLKVKKIGHAGTLDPLATGLLVICTGKFTKKINEYQGQDKSYTGIIEIGKTTPSFDLETDFDSETAFDGINEEDLIKTAKLQTGVFEQMPPIYSAIKVDGKRAYKSARENKEVKIQPREVRVENFEITAIDLPEVHFKIVCSKGTYIRSMANDFGKHLGCGAYLKNLCRTAIGEHSLKNAHNLNDFVSMINQEKLDSNAEA